MTTKKKIILGIVIIALGAGIYAGWPYVKGYWQYRMDVKYVKDMEQTYREDTYGGQTPEETFDLFLSAVKKGDLDLASKYYRLSIQDKKKAELIKMKEDGSLVMNLNEWENIRSKWSKIDDTTEKVIYHYTVVIPKNSKLIIDNEEINLPEGKKIGRDVIFIKNKYSSVWKIDLL